jgi:hypothetical protein
MALAFVSVFGLVTRQMALERRLSSWEKSERLTPQRLAELAELNTAVERGLDLLKKLNQREVMRARRDDGTYAPMHGANGSDKDELRRRAGLRAGNPAPHQ